MVFAFSTHHTFMNKILVLIASIHKYYPSKRILLYDSDVDDKGLLQKQLISIRNVQVLPSAIATKSLQPDALKSQMDALFMLDAVKRYKNVLWLTDDLEILSTNLDEVLNKSSSSVAVIGREYTTDIRKHGFIPYFPGTFSTRNYTLLLLRDGSESMLQWIVKCAAEPNRRCWNCRDVLGEQMDCMPSLIARLSLDIRAEYHMMPSNAVQHQRWQPTTSVPNMIFFNLDGKIANGARFGINAIEAKQRRTNRIQTHDPLNDKPLRYH
ncbi:unnamed protein product [Nippostrongylus brasiliensis]|uniref:Nucleotid_trans domain-containing protein n=1 Tax=Nippostrongylus brasiliensis TaxID=27835 RepID=A0A158QYV2_NIPBR|nr:unnamed protein product [Nippostrongylus brasiliensis]